MVEPTVVLEWRQVASGHDRTCGITVHSFLYCWGSSTDGRLGTDAGPHDRPNPVVGNRRWRAVAVGREHTCAVELGGDVYCWGGNESGQLGINDPTVEFVTEPTKVDTNQKFTEIAAGWDHTCGVTTANRVFCWGSNESGRLGRVTRADSFVPLPVEP